MIKPFTLANTSHKGRTIAGLDQVREEEGVPCWEPVAGGLRVAARLKVGIDSGGLSLGEEKGKRKGLKKEEEKEEELRIEVSKGEAC